MADGGGSLVNKKLGRLVDPTMGLYFVVLLVFAAASFLLNQPMLAAAEVGAAAALLSSVASGCVEIRTLMAGEREEI